MKTLVPQILTESQIQLWKKLRISLNICVLCITNIEKENITLNQKVIEKALE